MCEDAWLVHIVGGLSGVLRSQSVGRVKTVTPHRTRMMHHRRIFFTSRAQLFIQCTCIGSRDSRLKMSFICQRHSLKSRHRLVSHRSLLGLPANPPRFPTLLETELGANCANPRSGSWFGCTVEQNPLTGSEPSSLIEISSEYTPINFHSRRNNCNADLNSVPTTIAASAVADFHGERQLTSPLFTQET